MYSNLIFFMMPIVLVLVVGLCAVCSHLHDAYGEIFRPLIGRMLFKAPMSPHLDPETLFRAAILGNPVETMGQLRLARSLLQGYIDEQSYFRLYDERQMLVYFNIMRRRIENQERFKEFMNERRMWEEPAPAVADGWRKTLHLEAHCKDVKTIKTSYRKLVSKDHPDHGGTGTKMSEYNKALAQARSELNFV